MESSIGKVLMICICPHCLAMSLFGILRNRDDMGVVSESIDIITRDAQFTILSSDTIGYYARQFC